jgi:hypothetical protein
MENLSPNLSKDEFDQFASFLPDNLGEFEERFTAKALKKDAKPQEEKLIESDTTVKDSQTRLFSSSSAPWHQSAKVSVPAPAEPSLPVDVVVTQEINNSANDMQSKPFETETELNNSAPKNIYSIDLSIIESLLKKYLKLIFNPKNIFLIVTVYFFYQIGSGFMAQENVSVSNASIAASDQPKAITDAYHDLTVFSNSGRSYLEFTTIEKVTLIKKEGSVIIVYKNNGSCWFAGMVGSVNAPPESDPSGDKCSDKQLAKLKN